jgi:hypothetical protein
MSTAPEDLEVITVRESSNVSQDLNISRTRFASDCVSVIKETKGQNTRSYCHILQKGKTGKKGLTNATLCMTTDHPTKNPHNI